MVSGRSGRLRGLPLVTVCIVVLVALAGCSFSTSFDVGSPPGDGDPGSDSEAGETDGAGGGTDAADANDPDDDGLATALEREIGTDPRDSDTDGDRLLDGWEHRNETPAGGSLANADPLSKDLYLQVNYATEMAALTDAEKRNLTAIWAGMNVTNPDGERGISLHLDDDPPHGGPIDATFTATNLPEEFIPDQYAERVPRRRQCVFHGSIFLDRDQGHRRSGRGAAPGYGSWVATSGDPDLDRETTPGNYTWRVRTLTHETLHNVVGMLGPNASVSHPDSGWLAHGLGQVEFAEGETAARYQRLSPESRERLSTDGFAHSDYYRIEVCSS